MENPLLKQYKYCPNCNKYLAKVSIGRSERLKCANCGFIFWNNPRSVVSAIIAKGNKLLLIKRALAPLINYWCLPGGIIDYEETPEEATLREVKEETGLDITIHKLVGVYRIDNDPRGVSIDCIYYGLIPGKQSIQLSEEHSEFQFFSPLQLPAQIAYKHREAISDWYKKGSKYV